MSTAVAAPVLTQQYPAELDMILDVYRELRPSRVLEIGTLYGGTLYHWMVNAPGALVINIDLPLNGEAQQKSNRWQTWANEHGVTLTSLFGDSHSPFAIKRAHALAAPYDFIFVDGDHYLPGVRQDFENYYPMLRPGGCMAFHDICAPDNSTHIHVGKWWRELVASGQYNTQELIREGADESGGIGLVWK